jgi:hypothetical protein
MAEKGLAKPAKDMAALSVNMERRVNSMVGKASGGEYVERSRGQASNALATFV